MRLLLATAVITLAVQTASAQHVKIVGIGASSCAQFKDEVTRTPRIERDYLAWAQGFMSAVILNAPKGRDESLDLAPETFPLREQAAFLAIYCSQNPDRNYGDAVIELYLKLRRIAGEK